MNTLELVHYALSNSFGILGQVTADLTQEQADWMPPGTANPIGGLYWHAVASVDMIVFGWGVGQPPLFEREGWQEKVVQSSSPPKSENHPPEIRETWVHLPSLHDYSRAVGKAAKEWLASLTPEDMEREIDTPIGQLNLAQMLVSFVIWHLDAHCGEISALKGCQGARGYPF